MAKVLQDIEVQVEKPAFGIAAAIGATRYVKATESIVNGYSLSFSPPYQAISMEAEPKHQNLFWYKSSIAFLLSKTSIAFFHFYVSCNERNWEVREISDQVRWRVKECKLTDSEIVKATADQILMGFYEKILNDVNEKFKETSSPEEGSSEVTEEGASESNDSEPPESQ